MNVREIGNFNAQIDLPHQNPYFRQYIFNGIIFSYINIIYNYKKPPRINHDKLWQLSTLTEMPATGPK